MGNKAVPKVRGLTPENCSCVFTFALPYFLSTHSEQLSGGRGDSRVARVSHSLLHVCSSKSLEAGTVQCKCMHSGTVLYREFGLTMLDIRQVAGRAEAPILEKICRRCSEKAVAQ